MVKWVNKITEFVGSGVFALSILLTLSLWSGVMLVILIWPQNFSSTSAMAANFKMWCFGYDPLTGQYNKPQLLMLVLDPLFMGGLVFVVWKKGIIDLLKNHRKTVWSVTSFAALLVIGTLVGIAQVQASKLGAGKNILDAQLLRTTELAPSFKLTDQHGNEFKFPLENSVTIVSAFYTHCEHTCPQIIEQARRALQKSKLDPNQIQVALISLDPERDTVEVLKSKSEKLNLPSNWHLLTGNPKYVNEILDLYQVARVRDADGNIGHSNIFYVIDKQGKLAFRVGLGTTQEAWLRQAIELLQIEKKG